MPDFSSKTWQEAINTTNNLPYLWSYRGHFYDNSSWKDFTAKDMREYNAKCIADQLYNGWWGGRFDTRSEKKGWTLLAIAGAFGNFQSECSLNPGLIERKYTDPDTGGGMGLAQWTPNKRYRNWCDGQGLEYHRVETQCMFMCAEAECLKPMGEQEWLKTWPFSFYEYTQLEGETPSRAALIFGQNYERPAAGEYTKRQEDAEEWYKWLTKNPPKLHPIVSHNFNWIYYLRRRRDLYG